MTVLQARTLLARSTYKFFHDGTLKAYGVMIEITVSKLTTLYCLIGWAYSLQASAGYAISPLAGFLDSRFDRRDVALVGGILVPIGYLCRAGIPNASPLLIAFFVLISGIGLGLLNFTTILSLRDAFPGSYATWYSISSLAADLGIAVLPVVLDRLTEICGEDLGVVIFGILTGCLVLTGFLIPRDNAAMDMKCSTEMQKRGCDHSSTADDANRNESVAFLKEADGDTSEEKVDTNGDCIASDTWYKCYTTMYTSHPEVYYHTMIDGIIGYVSTGWAIFLVPYGVSIGLDLSTAVWLSFLGGVAGFAARGFCAVLYYKGYMNLNLGLVFPFMIIIAGYSLSISMEHFYSFAAMAVLTGFGLSMGKCVVSAIVPSLVCDYHFQYLIITQYTIGGVLNQLGGLLTGAVVDFTGSYRLTFGVLAGLSFIQMVVGITWSCSRYRNRT